jgi:hypothetical protein
MRREADKSPDVNRIGAAGCATEMWEQAHCASTAKRNPELDARRHFLDVWILGLA